MGIMGLAISQVITVQGLVLYAERYPFPKNIIKFLLLLPANAVTHIPYICVYAVNFILGLLGYAKFKVTAKGLNTGWLKAEEMYVYDNAKDQKWKKSAFFFKGRLILWSSVLGMAISFIMLFVPSPFPWIKLLYWIPLTILPLVMGLACKDVAGEAQFKKELWPKDKTKFSSVNALIIMNLPLLVPVIAGIFIWRSPLLLWSLPYMIMPIISVLVPCLHQPSLANKIAMHKRWAFPAIAFGLVGMCGGIGLLFGGINAALIGIGIMVLVVPIIKDLIMDELRSVLKTSGFDSKITELARKYFADFTTLKSQKKCIGRILP